MILHLFESVLDSEHEEDLICLTDKLDRVLDVSPDSDIMGDMLIFRLYRGCGRTMHFVNDLIFASDPVLSVFYVIR